MSLGSEVCAVRTVEIKPGTAEQNVLKLINSTWLESQVPIYNNPPPPSSLLYLVCIPDSKHASIMMNTPNWDAPTGHQSGQENKHANTHTHAIRSQHSRGGIRLTLGRLMERLRRLSIKTPGRITTISHHTGNKQGQSDILNFYKRPNMELKDGAALGNAATQLLGLFMLSFTELMIFHFKKVLSELLPS